MGVKEQSHHGFATSSSKNSCHAGPKSTLSKRKIVAQAPDASLEELRSKLNMKVGLSILYRALNELKLASKKVIHTAGG
jgi:hypothetical protein